MNIALFGQSDQGEYATPERLHSLSKLYARFGHPEKESRGIALAIETLVFGRDLTFIRVREEGFSTQDYLKGIDLLSKRDHIDAICLPGVSDVGILEACKAIADFVITTEKDLFDLLPS